MACCLSPQGLSHHRLHGHPERELHEIGCSWDVDGGLRHSLDGKTALPWPVSHEHQMKDMFKTLETLLLVQSEMITSLSSGADLWA